MSNLGADKIPKKWQNIERTGKITLHQQNKTLT